MEVPFARPYLTGNEGTAVSEVIASGWLSQGPRVRAFEAATGRGDAPLSKEAWEEQYRKGGWDFMRRLDEVARYSVIAGFLHHLKPGGSVLDVGSG